MNGFYGKTKAVTFSFDDGVTQDVRLIGILDRYGLKATFNLNSSLLGLQGELESNGRTVRHDKNPAGRVAEIYAGHEVAVHTLTHPNLTALDDDAVVWQVEEDRKTLGRLAGYDVRCMAYPCGGVNCDERVAKVLRERTQIRFARTIVSSGSFFVPDDLFLYDPTVYYADKDRLFELGEKFIRLQADKPQVFYIWGHSYEMDDGRISWSEFEEFCQLISRREDIFYGTNAQVFLPR
ncbi:MAG: polysaccharide deacetylase family protein [Candidatus Borkfalkiaceae bacterium]|nr:polysaccharide deacetylase family protein [Christensenellaceae bacterium]